MPELKRGDIIIFKAEDSWLSKAIAWLTDSNVSHAAMVYSGDSIVEVGARGIVVSKVNAVCGDDAYVMRLSGAPDADLLIRSADNYLNAKARYDFPELFLLAGLLLYQKIPFSGPMLSVYGRIFAAATFELDQLLQHLSKHSDEPAMVCSQLVYQIFYDCGGKYRIQIQNKTFSYENGLPDTANEIPLIDMITDSPAAQQPILQCNGNPDTPEALARELLEALNDDCNSEEDSLLDQYDPGFSNTVMLARTFYAKVTELLARTGSTMPMEAMFVTPADLAFHAKNLDQICMLDITRIK